MFLDEDRPLYRAFYSFWLKIFDEKLYPSDLGDANAVKDVIKIVYDTLMSNYLLMLQKLNLRYEEKTDDPRKDSDQIDSGTMSHQSIMPLNRNDQILFFNSCEFAYSFLKHNHIELMARWIGPFLSEIIPKSLELPLVSGYYKLVTVINAAAVACNLFDVPPSDAMELDEIEEKIAFDDDDDVTDVGDLDVEPPSREHEPTSSSSPTPSSSMSRHEIDAISSLLVDYVSRVLKKIYYYKDELLASSLKAVLSVPPSLSASSGLLHNLCVAVVKAFELGQNYLPVASIALKALESWNAIDANLCM